MQPSGVCTLYSTLSKPLKYYIIVGESSGDLYGGLLMSKIRDLDPEASFKFWGGPEMRKHSSGQLKSIKETSFMGFWEVAKNANKIKGFFDFAKYSINEFAPDIVLFIDYPGFNLRMMRWAKEAGYKTAYYISPQLWAWKEKRHKILRDKADLFFVILPFERDFYKNLDTPCQYIGHPLVEIIQENKSEIPPQIQRIGLFPGSRRQEIEKHLPTLLTFAAAQKEHSFVIAGVSHIPKSFYLDNIDRYAPNIDIVYDQPYEVMRHIDFAISSSGTATLELALFEVPQIVIYKTSPLSFMIAKRLVKTKYISLVNLIAQKEVVPELLQDAFNESALKEYFLKMKTIAHRQAICNKYKAIRKELGQGTASAQVAQSVVQFLKKESTNATTSS